MFRILLLPRRPIRSAGASSRSGVFLVAAALGAIMPLVATVSVPRYALAAEVGGTQRNVIVHGLPPAVAEAVRLRAEGIRHRVRSALVERDSAASWRVACHIHVHATPAEFEAAVGGPPGLAHGATSIEFAGEDIVLRRIDLLADDGGDATPEALAHEMVHVVLAERFTLAPPPRWADEGLAVLFDPLPKQAGHDADFRRARDVGMSWSTADLVALEEFPAEAGRLRVFYGQSAALVRWLLTRGDAETLITFLADCGERGFEAALVRHYALEVADVELAWKEVPTIEALSLNR